MVPLVNIPGNLSACNATLPAAERPDGRKEVARGAAKNAAMDAHERLVTRIADEQDDILGTIQLVDGDAALQDRLFEQLVDLLVEGMFLGLREQYLDGTVARDDYIAQLGELAERCRSLGLLPLPSRPQ